MLIPHLRYSCRLVVLLLAIASALTPQESRWRRLPNHVPPKATARFDRGAVDQNFQLASLTLVSQPLADRQARLDALLEELQDKSSPRYHQWLTPEQFADEFGLSRAEIDVAVSWLKSRGFSIEYIARGRRFIRFSGTAGQVRDAFRTEIHRFDIEGVQHFANTIDPAVPDALGSTAAILGLHDFRPRPRKPVPAIATGDVGHAVGPDDFATIYNVAPLYKAGIDGTGQTIIITGQSAITTANLQSFRAKFNLPNKLPRIVLTGEDPGIDVDWLREAELDLEWSGAVARNAEIVYVYSRWMFDAAAYAIDQKLGEVISLSYSECESAAPFDLYRYYRELAQQANAQGMTLLVASGDAGAATCDVQGSSIAQNGFAVSLPASVPEVTAVGGTTFDDRNGTYWTAEGSAMSYIPEQAWNQTIELKGNWASGGGVSGVFEKPAWQNAPGVPDGRGRDVPDVALAAANYAVFFDGVQTVSGGTSASAPAFAGIVALLNHYLVSTGAQKSPGLGNINPALYTLARVSSDVFHDITEGDNFVPCVPGSLNCSGGFLGYRAGPGYDHTTGLGSVDAYRLATAWNAPSQSSVVLWVAPPIVYQTNDGWRFNLHIVEEAGMGTTITDVFFNGTRDPSLIADWLGNNTTLKPREWRRISQLGYKNLDVPNAITIGLAGIDASGRQWSQEVRVEFRGLQPLPTIARTVNAASLEENFAPGEIVSIIGDRLSTRTQAAVGAPLPLSLGNNYARINSTFAPFAYVSPERVDLQIPYESAPGRAKLDLWVERVPVTHTFMVGTVAPGIFTGTDRSLLPSSNAERGQTRTLYFTGAGAVSPIVKTGALPDSNTPQAQWPKPKLPVSVTVGGIPAAIQFVGLSRDRVGVVQVDFQTPRDAPLGVQPVVVSVGGTSSPAANLTIAPATVSTASMVDLAPFFNRTGIYADAATFSRSGGLDGNGYGYSAALLGTAASLNGVTFRLGAAGAPNVMSCNRVTIPLPAGKYSSLAMLGTGVNGSQTAAFQLVYADGSVTTITLRFSDWGSPANHTGETTVSAMSYRNTAAGIRDNFRVFLYEYSLPLNVGKTVAGLILPDNANIEILALSLVDGLAAPAPEVVLTEAPPYLTGGTLTGRVRNIDPDANAIICYIDFRGAWWVKPVVEVPRILTPIQKDGTWSCSISTAPTDVYATVVAAFAVPRSYSPPALTGATELPPDLYSVSLAGAMMPRSLAPFASTLAWAPKSVDFKHTPRGSAPPMYNLSLTSLPNGVSFSTAMGPGCEWLAFTSRIGVTPFVDLAASVKTAVADSLPPGVYTCRLTATAPAGSDKFAIATLPVTLTITSGPLAALSISPASATYVLPAQPGPGPGTRPFVISAPVGGVVSAILGSGCNWVNLGGLPSSLNIALNLNVANTLGPGNYQCDVSLKSAAAAEPAPLILTLAILPAPVASSLTVDYLQLVFNYIQHGGQPPAYFIAISSIPSGVAYTSTVTSGCRWFDFTPGSGVTPARNIHAALDTAVADTMDPGTYGCEITVAAPGVTGKVTVTVPVTLTIKAPTITVSPTAWTYSYPPPSPPTGTPPFSARTSIPAQIEASLAPGCNWLNLSAANGWASPVALSLSVNSAVAATLRSGSYSCEVALTARSVPDRALLTLTLVVK